MAKHVFGGPDTSKKLRCLQKYLRDRVPSRVCPFNRCFSHHFTLLTGGKVAQAS